MDAKKIITILEEKNISVYFEEGKLKTRCDKRCLTPENVALIKENKALLIEYLSASKTNNTPADSIARLEKNTSPLSYPQQSLWLLDQIENGSAEYNISKALVLSGGLDIACLEQSLLAIVQRHEVLRTVIVRDENDHPVQVVNQIESVSIPLTDLSMLEEGDQEREIDERVMQDSDKVFNLAEDLMVRAELLKLSSQKHVLLFSMHHIAADGWSLSILIKELITAYTAYKEKQNDPFSTSPALPIQYSDYAQWQRDTIATGEYDNERNYWRDQLNELPPLHSLPLDYPRSKTQHKTGAIHYSDLGGATFTKLKEFCSKEGATLFMGLHASFSSLLSRYSNEQDIVIGTPVANRDKPETLDLIGFFVNMLVLRSHVVEDITFKQLLAQSKSVSLDAYEHQNIPFPMLVDDLQPERDVSISPLFQITLALQPAELDEFSLADLNVGFLPRKAAKSAHDLTLVATETQTGLALEWEYNTTLFSENTIQQMAVHFEQLLTKMLMSPNSPIKAIDFLSNRERNILQYEWNDTASDFPEDRCIHELFEARVRETPDAIAIVFADEHLTYRQLNEKANRLAHYLKHQGVKEGDLVGLAVERSLEMLIGVYGILKAGAAYVAIEPTYPEGRLEYLLSDSQVKIVLTQERFSSVLPLTNQVLYKLDAIDFIEELAQYPTDNLTREIAGLSATSLAYVIYTSGSTGQPKGVLCHHQALVNRVIWMEREYDFSQHDTFLQKTPFSFDVSVWELTGPLASGAKLVLAQPEGHKDPQYLAQIIRQEKVTALHFVPSMLSAFLDTEDWNKCTSVKHVFCGGEALTRELKNRFFDTNTQSALHNIYGPAEATIDVSYWQSQAKDTLSSVPIGKPISNIQLYVCNSQMALSPIGVPGELHVGGVGLARGYLNRQELTEEKFIQNPFSEDADARLYKTGDIVRWLPNGSLEFLSRIDHQVKVRGFRVELNEVEEVIIQCDQVRSCAVITHRRGRINEVNCLVAYVVPQSGFSADISKELREFLSHRVPEYMIPDFFIQLDELPINTNGKLDRKKLPEVDTSVSETPFVEPKTQTELHLCELYSKLLEIENVGIREHFFHAGGNSLIATRLMAKIRKEFNANISLKTLFINPVIADLAVEIDQQKGDENTPAIVPQKDRKEFPLSYSQQRLWLLDQIESGSCHYNMPAVLEFNGPIHREAFASSLQEIVLRHEVLRTNYIKNAEGEAIQVVQEAPDFVMAYTDLSQLNENIEARLENMIRTEVKLGFDLKKDLMLRAQLVKTAENRHTFLVTMHHIASDGWSTEIVMSELSRVYQRVIDGVSLEGVSSSMALSHLPLQYRDYACWQRSWLAGDTLDKKMVYWREALKDLPPVHDLPLDRARPSRQTYSGKIHTTKLNETVFNRLGVISKNNDTTLFMTLYAAFSAFLSRYSQQEDIVVGSPVANREQNEIEGLIGFFVNTLVLRSRVLSDSTFKHLLNQSKQTVIGAYDHQQVPFELLVEELQPERNQSHSPLFQIMMVYQNQRKEAVHIPGVDVTWVPQKESFAKFDLAFHVVEKADSFELKWEYNEALFNPSTIERMALNFNRFVDALSENPDKAIKSLPLIHEKEVSSIINHSRGPNNPFDLNQCIHQVFEERAEKHPQSTALLFGEQSITYKELNEKANRLAHYLREKGITQESLVGICVNRSVEMIVFMLAVLKSGAAYVPLDPGYPVDRLCHMVEDSDLKLVLTHSELRVKLPENIEQVILADDKTLQKNLKTFTTENISPNVSQVTPASLAYVIYTSGSTGQPKGVMIEHHGVCNLAFGQMQGFNVSQKSRVFQFASFSFDAAVSEIWMTFSAGATLVIADDETVKTPSLLEAEIVQHHVSHITLPPAFLPHLNIEKWSKVNTLIVAGESCPIDIARKWAKERSFINAYGPTENTVCATFGEFKNTDSQLSIGKPMANVSTYVFDANKQLLPIGVPGELYIGGTGLARGYLNKPELTEKAFVQADFSESVNLVGEYVNDERLYKTGDLVCLNESGHLEFIGRRDNQVKLRGFRIELSEINSILLSENRVEECFTHLTGGNNPRLVTYAVKKSDEAGHIPCKTLEHETDLLNVLREKLPQYMVPDAVVFIEKMPLTVNGKVDVKKLPEPPEKYSQAFYLAPVSEQERILCEACETLLEYNPVGLKDNFFHLGGHSLLAVQLIALLQKKGYHLSISAIFESPSLVDLAEKMTLTECLQAPERIDLDAVEELSPSMFPLATLNASDLDAIISVVPGGKNNILDIYSLTALQKGMLFHHRLDKARDPYAMPFLMRVKNWKNIENFQVGLSRIIERHDVLRTVFLWDKLSDPVQVVLKSVESKIKEVQLCSERNAESQMREMFEASKTSIALSQSPIFELTAARDPQSESCYLLMRLHHIIWDHSGLDIFLNEMEKILKGQEALLGAAIPFREYVAQSLNQSENKSADSFFENMLSDVNEPTAPYGVLELPQDREAVVAAETRLTDELSTAIRETAKKRQISAATLFHAAWSLVLSACVGRPDVVFGTVLLGRLQGTLGAESSLGLFINTLPFRLNLQKVSCEELVNRTQALMSELLNYEQYPLVDAQDYASVPKGSPLFGSILNYRHIQPEKENDQEHGVTWEVVAAKERTNYPFTISVNDFGESFGFTTQVIDNVVPEKINAYFEQAISSVVSALEHSPDMSVSKIQVIPDSECEVLKVIGRGRKAPLDNLCLHHLFEKQAEKIPEAIAIEFEGKTLTYQQLNQRANQVAHMLVARQVGQGDRVGLCLHRSIEMIVAVLGILKSGAAYVPIDPEYPQERKKVIVDHTGMTTILTQHSLLSVLDCLTEGHDSLSLVDLDGDIDIAQSHIQHYSSDNRVIGLDDVQQLSSSAAYVIYTSGSTGKPKGVEQTHQTIANLVLNANECIQGSESILQSASICFDVSTQEIFTALLSGIKLVLFSGSNSERMEKLSERVMGMNTPSLYITPLVLNWLAESSQLKQHNLANVQNIIVAGDKLTLNENVAAFLRDNKISLWNHYGPTETHLATVLPVLNLDEKHPSIGQPIANTDIYLLNENMSLVPLGVVGEVCVGGAGLAKGYLGDIEQTKKKFIDCVIAGQKKTLYRTGDLARWNPDGMLEYLGRMDHQVKIRGFRIELGEVEKHLASYSIVRDVVVSNFKDEYEEKRLAAYVIAEKNGEGVNTQIEKGLREKLSADLPSYMVPELFIFIDEIPLSSNGKVDRKRLPNPMDIYKKRKESDQGSLVLPETQVEKTIARCWQKILGISSVSMDDNFFYLGGNSISVTRVVTELNTKLKIDIPVKDIFNYPVLKDFSASIEKRLTYVQGKVQGQLIPITRIDRDNPVPLSHTQRRLWLLDRIDETSGHYNIPITLELEGEINAYALEAGLLNLVQRHEILRTSYEQAENGEPVQVINPCPEMLLKKVDLSHLHNEAQKVECELLLKEESCRSFDLNNDLMIRASLLKLTHHQHLLNITIHHIACDGWSLSVLVQELGALYKKHLNKGSAAADIAMSQPSFQYADYAGWQEKYFQSGALEEHVSYWKQKLSGLPTVHSLPLDHARPQNQEYNGKTLRCVVDKVLLEKLKNTCLALDATLFMGIHAAFSALLSRYSDEVDIAVGTPVANRNQAEVAEMVGFFVNTLVLRSDLSSAITFNQLIEQSRCTVTEAFDHQQVPFEALVDELNVTRSLNHSPLFQVMLVMQNNERNHLQLPGVKVNQVESHFDVCKFDITLSVSEQVSANGNALALDWQYNISLFDEKRIATMASDFNRLLETLVAQPREAVQALPFLSESIKNQELNTWNKEKNDSPKPGWIIESFDKQVETKPDNIGLIHGENQLTYAEIQNRTNQLARYLRGRGVKPGGRVGMYLELSVEAVISIIAVLKAGAAYIPLDTSYPSARIDHILSDANPDFLITTVSLMEELSSLDMAVICADDAETVASIRQEAMKGLKADDLNINGEGFIHGEDLAWIIYTSGSTGRPKGVMVERDGVANLMHWYVQELALAENDKTLIASSMGFDLTQKNFFASLMAGGTLVLPEGEYFDPVTLLKEVKKHKVTHINCAPSVIYPVIDLAEKKQYADLKSLRNLVLGGEPIKIESLLPWLNASSSKAKLLNSYGPSECTDVSSYSWYNPNEGGAPAIGLPIDNVQLYLLNEYYQLCPPGTPGEIYIGGAGVARGYLNKDTLNKSKFIKNVFSDEPGEKLYRTGDLAKRLPNGELEFIGRKDNQVKIRGVRIELGEIEYAVCQHEEISKCVVDVRKNAQSEDCLVGYLVCEGGLDKSQIENQIMGRLRNIFPSYMVPAGFVFIDSIPLSYHGKIDRRALPEYVEDKVFTAQEKPASKMETELLDLWRIVLEIDRIGVTDDFFSLGGNSLKAVQMSSLVKNKFGIPLKVKTIMQFPTIRGIATQLGSSDQLENRFIELWNPNQREVNRDNEKNGCLPSTPTVLSWNEEEYPNRFNLPSMVTIKNDVFDMEAVKTSLKVVFSYHDGTRLQVDRRSGRVEQKIVPLPKEMDIHFHDFSALTYEDGVAEMRKVDNELQESFAFDGETPLYRLAYFKLNHEEPHRLFLVFHHYLADGISLILLQRDFIRVYEKVIHNQAVRLPNKTLSLIEWNTRLDKFANSTACQQLPYWLEQERKGVLTKLKRDSESGSPYRKKENIRIVEEKINRAETAYIIALAKEHRFEVVNVVTYALVKAFAKRTGVNALWCRIVSNGRAGIFDDLEANELFGQIGNNSTILFETSKGYSNPLEQIKAIDGQMKSMENNGAGYTALRYQCHDPDIKEKMASVSMPQVLLNYPPASESNPFTYKGIVPAAEGTCDAIDGVSKKEKDLDFYIGSRVEEGELATQINYHICHFTPSTMQSLIDDYIHILKSLIASLKAEESVLQESEV